MTQDWHYTDLIKAHKILIRREERFRFYGSYMTIRDQNAWFLSPIVPLKEGLLLFGWVNSWDPNYTGELIDFLKTYEDLFQHFKRFEYQRIIDVDFTEDVKDAICLIFDKVANCTKLNQGKKKFESTDTSKVLHGIVPELFVMWDKRIKAGLRNEGFLNERRINPRDFDGTCYAHELMPGMQRWAKIFLSTYVKENGGNNESACAEISKMADGYTLSKLLDELNYLRFTLRMKMKDIRSVQ